MREVLIFTTGEPSLRSEVIGWTHEDPSLFVRDKPIGYTPAPRYNYSPKTAMQAMADGWELVTAPTREVEENGEEYWTWWMTKEKKRP